MRLNSCVFFLYSLFCHTINGIIALNGINYFTLGWEECKRSTNDTYTHIIICILFKLINKWIRMTLYALAGWAGWAVFCCDASPQKYRLNACVQNVTEKVISELIINSYCTIPNEMLRRRTATYYKFNKYNDTLRNQFLQINIFVNEHIAHIYPIWWINNCEYIFEASLTQPKKQKQNNILFTSNEYTFIWIILSLACELSFLKWNFCGCDSAFKIFLVRQ